MKEFKYFCDLFEQYQVYIPRTIYNVSVYRILIQNLQNNVEY